MRRSGFVLLLIGLSLSLCISAATLGSTFNAMAEAVAEDVGQILQVVEGDPDRVVFVFEERHDSILVQIEIGMMLDRLYADYGMRHIGLEGLAATEGPLDLSWVHRPPRYQPDQPITSREDVIAHTLFQGEIGAGEMLGLVYEDVVVDGIDDAALYSITTSEEIWSAPFNEGKYAEAEEYAISTSSFTQEFYDRLTDKINGPSAEETVEIYSLLRSRARRANVKLPSGTEQALQACMDFMEVVSERSDAIVSNALGLASAHRGAPVAINIGFMHTERIEQLLRDAGVSFVVFRSLSHASGTTAGLLSPEALERKAKGLSVGAEGHIGMFLDGRKKPEVTCTKWWYKTEEAVTMVIQILTVALHENLNSESPAEDEFDYLMELLESDEYRSSMDGLTLREYLRKYNAGIGIIAVETSDVDGSRVPHITYRVPVVDPETGDVITRLVAEVQLIPYSVTKPTVTLRTLLEWERERLGVSITEPTTDVEEERQPVKACSNITVVWKGA